MSVELNNEWVLCRSKCGEYKGYFKSSNIPPDYLEDNKAWISKKDFMRHFDLVDTCFDRAWEQTVDYFKKENSPLECEFEDVIFSRDMLKRYVMNALLTDMDRLVVLYGYEYDEWYYLESLLKRRDFFIVDGDNNYCVDNVLSELGLPSLSELQDKYTTDQLSYTIKNQGYFFILKEN